jgi:tRNA dimethylallyltransferase
MGKRYIAVIGPTASGKSDLAMRLAQELNGELVNCDSVQIYRGFDIGAAKPTAEEQALVPHHLVDLLSWNEDFDARKFAARADEALEDIRSRGRVPIVVGGTGLYLKALWQDGFHDLPKDNDLRIELSKLSLEELRGTLDRLDPRRSLEIHGNDRFRLQRAVEVATLLGHSVKDLDAPKSRRDEAFVIHMNVPRPLLHERIRLRSKKMLVQGLIEEVSGLLAAGVNPQSKPMQSIGYLEVAQFLSNELDRDELEEAIIIATRQYAKRQETLFRKMKVDLEWFATTELKDFHALWNRA